MNLQSRIQAFAELGKRIKNLSQEEFQNWFSEAKRNNSWFTEPNVRYSLEGIGYYLDEQSLTQWIAEYSIKESSIVKKVGVVMAGNIPLVGFHDFLCVLISGHTIVIKLSSNDNVLMKKITELLLEIEPAFRDRIVFADKLINTDAVIATGSDNSARYFHYYFSKIPHIIRQNRVSCAILNGNETKEDFEKLGKDILLYFGMGCRNVSKLYVPEGFNFTPFLDAIEIHRPLIDINKYYNNYDYNKSIFVVNDNTNYLDNGFLLLMPNKAMVSPMSVVYYEYYKTEGEVALLVESQKEKIQVVVSKDGWYPNSVPFGMAQYPALSDYADGVDTMEFLIQLKNKMPA